MQANLEQLRHGIDLPMPLWVLVDPLVGEPVAGIDSSQQDLTPQRQQVWERPVFPVQLAPSIELPLRKHPYLVKLRGADDPLLEYTLGIAEDERLAAQSGGLDGLGSAVHCISGWLQSAMPDADLTAALSRMCRVNTAVATRARYLRLVDRRVLGLLCHVAGEQRVAAQLGRLDSWTYLDPTGQLRRLRSPHEQIQSLRLSAQEWRRLGRSERLNRTISTWLGAQAAVGRAVDQFDYDVVEKAVLGAELAATTWPHRFQSSHDEITWGALSMRHPALPQLTQVHALMADTGSPDEPPEPVRYLYRDLLALVDGADGRAHSVLY